MDNTNKNIAIKVSNVKKKYRLGQIGGGTLQADLQSWWARKRGKEDPNTKIGTDQRSNGKTFMALNGLNLTIYEGEAVGIIGKNGAGKSTLLKLLSRVTAPTDGEIDIYGRIASMLEVGTGFNGEMTGRENIYMNGAILGMTREEIDLKMEKIIEFSEVREFIDTPVKRYSSGMFVKLAFSVAAHLDAEIMIMDEVLAVGDMAFQKKCLTKMKEAANQDGRTVLYVSHNMNTIRQLCDRCIVLDEGKVIYNGDVEKAISIYLDVENNNEYPVFYDFKDIKRTHHFGKKVFLNSFEFINKTSAIYNIGEEIKFKVNFHSYINMNDVILVLALWNDKDIRIGSAISNTFSIKKDTTKTLELNINFKQLVDKDYRLNLEIISRDNLGNYLSFDNPMVRIPIKFIHTETQDLTWSKRFWGDINLGEIETIDK